MRFHCSTGIGAIESPRTEKCGPRIDSIRRPSNIFPLIIVGIDFAKDALIRDLGAIDGISTRIFVDFQIAEHSPPPQ